MSSQVDFAIAVGLFIVFVATLFLYITGYMSSYTGLISISELRTGAYNIFNVLFGGKGIPENWEDYNHTPATLGLMIDLYRIPVLVTERSGTWRNNVMINASIGFDSGCEKKAWNSTVRVLEDEDEIASQLYNQTFCVDRYLNRSDIVFNSSFSANQTKTFFIYFSGETSIADSSYSLDFTNPSDFLVQVFPEEKFSALSISKLSALRNLPYEEVLRTLGIEYKFNIEIDAT